MAECKLTNKAVDDLSNIWEYTFEIWFEGKADRDYDGLISTGQDLA